MSDKGLELLVNKTLEKIDNYRQTLEAIISFSHVLKWDDENKEFKPNSYSFIARQMDTSKNNRIKPNIEINPDLIVQLDENYGIVGEVKKSFPQNKGYWKSNFNQIQKYDDDLKGWLTPSEYIKTADIVLLTHYKIKVDVADYLEAEIYNKNLVFNKNFSAIAFSRVQEMKTILTLEKFYGRLFDKELDERFRRIVRVPLDKVIPLSDIKFYDDKPELSYMMEILWNKIFSQYPKMEEFMESGGIKIINIEVNVDKLTQELRIQFTDSIESDTRQPELPKAKWVKEAMDMFVKLNYAKIENLAEDKYTVKFKSIKNTIEKFTKEIIESQNQKGKKGNLNNFL
ncbi:hypothetical protein LCGC14_1075390 [marine sediment metagenome]|uniref:Uncharacterized protein n=1 Tax=marine sediment metagenome TaxID=412755 RepID=A0A0F9PZY5_9ZZZZ